MWQAHRRHNMAIVLTDATGRGNNLTNNGATEVSSSLPFAQSTTAIDLASGSSQYLTAADNNDFSVTTTNKLTIEFWFKLTSLSNNNFAIYKGNTGAFEYGFLVGNASGAVQVNFWNSAGSSRYGSVTANSVVTTGTWYHLAYTVDDSVAWDNANGKLYLDATESTNSYLGSSANSLSNGNQDFNIGRNPFSSVFFNGKLDEIRVWNTVRSQSDINTNKSVRLTGSESGLVAYYPFEAVSSGNFFLFF